MYISIGDTVFTKCNLAHGQLFMGDNIYTGGYIYIYIYIYIYKRIRYKVIE